MDKLADHGGPIISSVVVMPIFWGSVWSSGDPQNRAAALIDDLRHLMQGPYMVGLSQYRDIQAGTIHDALFDTTSTPPATFSLSDLASYVSGLIAGGRVPDFRLNSQLLYLVVTDGGTLTDNTSAGGFHFWSSIDRQTFHFAWISNADSYIASHEIIEACTDPEANGYTQPENGIEVADICEDNSDAAGDADGVVAASYWSNRDSRCILPRRVAGIDVQMDDCGVGPAMGEVSELRLSLSADPAWIEPKLPPMLMPTCKWTFDPEFVTPLTATDGTVLVVRWAEPVDIYSTRITVTVTDLEGLQITGSRMITPRTPTQAAIARKSCEIRRWLASVNRIPPFFVHKLGPDPASLPTRREIERLARATERLSAGVEALAELRRRLDA
ncbi:MAG: hypothetical protein JSR59_08280 [Proteobacteria bacterium]|nr:hypothetical protein [Pseudomonadota bacterium]